MTTVSEIAKIIAESAGWSEPVTDNGQASFVLSAGQEFALFMPESNTLIIRSVLGKLPDAEAEGDQLARRLGQLSAGSFFRRQSILCLDEDRFLLTRTVDLAETEKEELPDIVGQFLNDLDWWRNNYPDKDTPAAEQMVPLPGGFVPGALKL